MNQWLSALADWLQTVSLHGTMQTVEWMVPAVQTIHILGIAAVFSSSLVLSLRVLAGVGADWSPGRWQQRLNGWIIVGMIVLLLSGIMMIVGEPARSLLNTLFQTKMVLLLVALVVLSLLALQVRQLDAQMPIPASARLLAAVLLVLWLVIIACGRWIAYS